MLGSVSQVEGECSGWITEHQERLEKAFRLASVRTEQEALRRQARSNLKATDTSLTVGARVLRVRMFLVVGSLLCNQNAGMSEIQSEYLFHTNAVIPHKTSHKLTLGL